MNDIDKLPLHDGVLKSIMFDWSKSTVKISLSAFIEEGKSAQPHVLKFFQVSELNIPQTYPWGESIFINGIEYENKICKIEIQSGDVITVNAKEYSFEPKTL